MTFLDRISRRRKPLTTATALFGVTGLALGLAACGSAGESEGFEFDGDITVVVPYAAGGPMDLWARTVSQELENHLPGQPTLVIENRPGAGGTAGGNFAAGSGNTDGTLVTMSAGELFKQITGDEAMQYDLTEVEVLAAFLEPEVFAVRSDLGIADVDDFIAYDGTLNWGGFQGRDNKSSFGRSTGELLGIDINVVTGYDGSATIRQAGRQGELDGFTEGLSSFYAGGLVDEIPDTFQALMHTGILGDGGVNGFIRDPRLEEFDLPTVFEVVAEQHGDDFFETDEGRAMTLQYSAMSPLRLVHLPPGTDEDAVEAWRGAFEALMNDDEAMARISEMQGYEQNAISGEEAAAFIEDTIAIAEDDPDAVAVLESYLTN